MRRRKGKETLTTESRTEKVSWTYLMRVKGEDTLETRGGMDRSLSHALKPKTKQPKIPLHNQLYIKHPEREK
jgi:hypothetical protein